MGNLERTAFELGYADGRKAKRHLSRAQAERKLRGLPGGAIDAYLNGHDDGVRGDNFRLRLGQALALAESRPASGGR